MTRDENGSVASVVGSSPPTANIVSSHLSSIASQKVSKKQPALRKPVAVCRLPSPLIAGSSQPTVSPAGYSSALIDMRDDDFFVVSPVGFSQPTVSPAGNSSAIIDMTGDDNGSIASAVNSAHGSRIRTSTVKRLVVKRKSTKQGNRKKKRKNTVPTGAKCAFIAQVATLEEIQAYEWRHKDIEIELSKEEIAVPPTVVNYWLIAKHLKMIPKNVDALNKGGVTDAERDEFLLGHNTDFVPYPDLNPTIGHTVYKRDDKGQVLAAATRTTLGVVKRRYPRVYYCHKDGFIICCKIGWSCKYAKKEQIKSGMVEGLGTRANQVFIRSYSVIRTHLNHDGYRRVTLYSDGCNKTSKTMFVAHLCLITFKGPRPDGYEGDHMGKRTDNSIEKLRWIPRSANSEKQNINQDRRYVSHF